MCNTSIHYRENENTAKHTKFQMVTFSKTCHRYSFSLNILKYHRLFQFQTNNIFFSQNKAVGKDNFQN